MPAQGSLLRLSLALFAANESSGARHIGCITKQQIIISCYHMILTNGNLHRIAIDRKGRAVYRLTHGSRLARDAVLRLPHGSR